MLHVRLGCLLVSGLLLAGCGGGGGGGGDPGEPITVTLRNDTYETGDPQAFVTTFLSGKPAGRPWGRPPSS